MRWSVEILWNGRWVTLESGYESKDSAEWAIGQWKQKNQCFRDPFRCVGSTASRIGKDPLQADANAIDHDADAMVRIAD